MRARSLLLSLLICITLLGCDSGGGGSDSATSVSPGMPCSDNIFDVWGTSFVPLNADHLSVNVELNEPNHAAQFRLTVACQAMLIDGSASPCSSSTPSGTVPPTLFCAPLPNGLDGLSRTSCLIEIVPIGECAAADGDNIATYRLSMTVGQNRVPLTFVADNCMATGSCLAAFFGINVTPNPTATPTATPLPPTATP